MRQQQSQQDYYQLVDNIKRIPIIEIYNRYVGGKLRHIGRKAVANCPWHGRDSSPSLTLYTDKGNWYCFGCQRGGTVIDMTMTALGSDFKSAVSTIARDFGLSDLLPDPAVRKKIHNAKERRDIEVSFDSDFDRIFLTLAAKQQEIAAKLQTYEDYEQNLGLVNDAPIIDGLLDDMLSARDQTEKVRVWRIARKVFPWLKKT